MITNQSAEELKLRKGDQVTAVIEATGVMIRIMADEANGIALNVQGRITTAAIFAAGSGLVVSYII